MPTPTLVQLRHENAVLRARLDEAEQTLEAIRSGQVDALVVSGETGDKLFTLSGAEHVYRVILENMNEGALALDPAGMILFANQQFARLVDRPMEALVGTPIFHCAAPAQRDTLARILQEAQSRSSKGRLVLQTPAKTFVHVQLSANPLDLGTAPGICLLVTDLTELEASAQSIAHLRQQQQDLEQRELQLRQTADELARSNRDLEQFAYVASHDLQEPLRQVSAFTKLLNERCGSQLKGDAVDFLGFIYEGVSRMSALVQDLLTFSRAGGKPRGHRVVPLQLILSAALDNLRTTLQEARAHVTHDDLPSLPVDPTQFTQVFQNFVGNAAKFRRPDVDPLIHIACRRLDDHWLFSIHDNGIGIAPENLEKIFQVFRRLHTRSQYPGTGIGLAICRKVVESHGGKTWAESQPGQGSTFFFTLPADPPNPL
jgi:PAS domain S-box-containing protein